MGRTILVVASSDAPEHHRSVEERDTSSSSSNSKDCVPLLGSFADVWECRQTSDIIMDELKKEEEEEQHLEETVSSATGTPRDPHPQRIVSRNPYSLSEPVTNLYTCFCVECSQQKSSRMGSQEYSVDVKHECNEGLALYKTPEIPSAFMPPPPPRPDTAAIIAYGGALNAIEIFRQLLFRWYRKTCEVQHYFVSENDMCPFEPHATTQWCQHMNTWWTKNFSHLQRKPQASHGGIW